MAAAKPFIFICGQDDYLVGRLGKERFDALAAEVTDEFSREVISGFAANVGEVEGAVNRLRESVQTIAMFGGRRVVWFKDVNFLADTVTGKAESTLQLVADLQEFIAKINPDETALLITAAPVDRRRAFPKWCEKNADFALADVGGENAAEALAAVAINEAKSFGASFAPGAVELLLEKTGANTRLVVEETHKLANYVGPDEKITEDHVTELTPNAAGSDFFEAAEAFFSGNLQWTLAALHRHFFAGEDARPVIATLQNRNRLLLQVRTLLDGGEIRAGPRGVEGLASAAATHAAKYPGVTEKNSYNIFTQNPWYLGKLVGNGKLPTLRRLIDNQQEFIAAFEDIHQRPHEQEEVLREMAVRCLT